VENVDFGDSKFFEALNEPENENHAAIM